MNRLVGAHGGIVIAIFLNYTKMSTHLTEQAPSSLVKPAAAAGVPCCSEHRCIRCVS